MDDILKLITSAFSLANDHKWLLLAATIIGGIIRLTKPDVDAGVLAKINIPARWRPVAAAALGVLAGVCNMLVTGSDWKAAMQWGLAAAATAMISHTFGIEVARNGREVFEAKPQARKPGDPPSVLPPPPPADAVDRDALTPPASFPKIPKAPTLFLVPLVFACFAIAGCSALLPVINEVLTDVADAAQILDAISSAEHVWFNSHPAADTQTKIEKAIADAHLALATALRATQGAKDLNDAEFDAAFTDFRNAWTTMQALLRDAGVIHDGGKVSLARGEFVLPQPLALSRHR